MNPGEIIEISLPEIDQNKIKKRKYFYSENLFNNHKKSVLGINDITKKLDKVLSEVIEDVSISDVNIGTFLSGGVDSSLISIYLQKLKDQPIDTFSVGFADEKYDESIYSKKISDIWGMKHNLFFMNNDDIVDTVQNLSNVYDEPFADSSQIPTTFLSKKTKESVSVILSGDGADEIFGGYSRYKKIIDLYNFMKLIPLPLRKILSFFLKNKFKDPLLSENINEFYDKINSVFYLKDKVFNFNTNTEKDYNLVLDNDLHTLMLNDINNYLHCDILTKVDRASMHYSLETRAPFLDMRVYELSRSINLNHKSKDYQPKWPLKNLLEKHLPKELVYRKKKGFGFPLAESLKTSLFEWSSSLICEKKIKKNGFFNYNVINQLWFEHINNKKDNSTKLWYILVFLQWYEKKFK